MSAEKRSDEGSCRSCDQPLQTGVWYRFDIGRGYLCQSCQVADSTPAGSLRMRKPEPSPWFDDVAGVGFPPNPEGQAAT